MAKVARFYGWSHREILSLPLKTFRLYFAQIPRIEAEEALSLSVTLSIPWMDKTDRSRVLFELRRTAGLEKPEDGWRKLEAKLKDGKRL